MIQFLILHFRISPFSVCLRSCQKSCPSYNPLRGKRVYLGGGWVEFKKLVFQNKPFTIPDAGPIIHTLDA